ncbi:MAG: glucose-6-phosphate dehydrogenase [Calditrichaeota bacterium]|nr:MAG: glucose-6-phosphate dehydrogenase [Calditrichota bacterium]
MKDNLPITIVIFGASGDLTRRKLVPALFQLEQEKLLAANTYIVGFARRKKSHQEFRQEMATAIKSFARAKNRNKSDVVQNFVNKLYYQSGNYDEAQSFRELKKLLDELDRKRGLNHVPGNRLYYLSTPPSVFAQIISMLGAARLIADPHDSERWSRVIVEKPFGHDLESAKALNREILATLDESQVYRIDHYLGKETVQNIMAFRFGNSIFEPLWNRRYVDHVEITVAESVNVGSRGGYYDQAGALRDMVQNHMLQLLALTAMEPPASFEPNAVRDEKVKVLKSLRLILPEEVELYTVRGQYIAGTINGQSIPNYRSEPGVNPDSNTETYVALKLFIDNWRWADVPFYLRTGKAMPKRMTEVIIEYKHPPLALFGHQHHEGHAEGDRMKPNTLTLRVQPDEGIRLTFGLKVPGPKMILQATDMEFSYSRVFNTEPPEAYERLLLDALLGDSTLFIRHDEVEAAWAFVDPILEGWKKSKTPVHPYWAGTWGPDKADEFIERDGRKWAELK